MSHLFEQAEERGTENVVKVLDVKALGCLHKVALQLVNVIKGCDLHRIDQLVVPDLCKQYLSQVFLELKSAFDYVDEVFGRLVGAVDNVFEKINLCVQDAQGDLKDSFSVKFDCVVGLDEIAHRENVKLLGLAPISQV